MMFDLYALLAGSKKAGYIFYINLVSPKTRAVYTKRTQNIKSYYR